MLIRLLITNLINWNKRILIGLILCLSIGTASLIGLFITLETFKKWIKEGLEVLGINRIVLDSYYKDPDNKKYKDISYQDILRLKQWCPSIKSLGCAYMGSNDGSYELILLKNKKKTEILNSGVSEGLAEVMGFEIIKGKFIEPKDEGRNVCVITENTANRLNANVGDTVKYIVNEFISFSFSAPVVKKKAVYLKIKGIIKIPELIYSIYHFPVADKDCDIIYVPVKTKKLLRLYDITWDRDFKPQDKYIGNIYIKVSNVEKAINEIKNSLKAKYGKDKVFFIWKDDVLIHQFKNIEKIWRLLLGTIGIGSLCMGIGNIFFTFLSFTNTRKREIGIKRACGCKRKDVCKEFLIEGIIIILPPIILGAGLGIICSKIFLKTPVISIDMIISCVILIFCFSLLALIYPAIRASFIPPADAIRE